MAIAFVTVYVRHERRVRFLFDAALAVGAFQTLSFYSLTAVNGDAANPTIVAAYSMPDSPHTVELHLGVDLVQGVLYEAAAVGVPAAGGGTTPSPSTTRFRVGIEPGDNDLGVPRQASALQRRMFGVDIVHDGNDFVLTPDHDLAQIAGARVVKGDLERRLLANGLPWARLFGLGARRYVDAPTPALSELPPLAVVEMLNDDRVVSATAEVLLTNDGTSYISVRPVVIGDRLVSSLGDIRAPIA